MPTHGSSNAGAKNSTGMTSTPANAGIGEDRPKAFDVEGTIGKQFTSSYSTPSLWPGVRLVLEHFLLTQHAAEGALGGAAQKVGGPFDKDGAVGHAFTTEGSVGGTVQDKMGGTKGRSN